MVEEECFTEEPSLKIKSVQAKEGILKILIRDQILLEKIKIDNK